MKMIPKAENTFDHEYDQSGAIKNMAKVMQSKQCNQRYGQSNQSDMTSNTIKTTLEVVSVTSLM